MLQERENNSREIAMQATKLAREKKGHDLVLLDVGKVTYLADYFLICTGTSVQQVQTISDHLREEFKKSGVSLLRTEGYNEARWVLLDYGAVVVHIFQPDEREFYNLERLWSTATQVILAGENRSVAE